jgi:hypothetical protein
MGACGAGNFENADDSISSADQRRRAWAGKGASPLNSSPPLMATLPAGRRRPTRGLLRIGRILSQAGMPALQLPNAPPQE